MSRFLTSTCGVGLLALGLAGMTLSAQQNGKRLVLKDGSYQPASAWEIKGDRVRFYSAERYDWEELPTSLVDWPATDEYNRQLGADRAAGVLLNKEPAREVKPGPAELPQVAPGLSLPDDGGIFLLDNYQGHAQLVPLEQNAGELNKHTGRNILRAAINPLALSSKQSIELKGAHAAVEAHVAEPVFYLDLDPGETPVDAQGASAPAHDTLPARERYRIVRMQSNKDVRVVGNLNIAVTGKMKQKENWVPTTSTPVGAWIKITCDEPLPQGEYAIVELLGKGQINLYVWDFGVDASRPANRDARTADTVPLKTNAPPSLEKRPN
jgi:hypothetical protein